jgi:hypothetical protein
LQSSQVLYLGFTDCFLLETFESASESLLISSSDSAGSATSL